MGITMEQSNKPIIKYLSPFLEYLEIEKGLSNKTQENYRRFLEKFIKWLKLINKTELKPHQLTPELIWKYRVFLARSFVSGKKNKKTLKKSTQNYYLIALRALLGYLVKQDILTLPPDKIKLARDKYNKTVKFLTLEEVEKLLLSPNVSKKTGLRDRAILETLFSTGLRVAELVGLDREQIKIRQNTKYLEIGITGKGGHPRTVYFSERAIKWIKKYLQTRKDKYKPLFINYKRKSGATVRLSSRSIENIVKKYSKIAGIPINATPHTLRHSYATDLLNQGADLRVVQELLGHQNIATTQIYTHITNKRLREIHQKFHSGNRLKE